MYFADLVNAVKSILKILLWPVVVLFDTLTDPVIAVLIITTIASILGLCFAIVASPTLVVFVVVAVYIFGLANYIKNRKDFSPPIIFWKVACDGILLGIAIRYLGYLA